jgi:hypothetical protein
LLLSQAAGPAEAQTARIEGEAQPVTEPPESMVVVRGKVIDAEERPVVGYTVVLRMADAPEIFFSNPTSASGEYAVPLPAGKLFEIVAVISPGYERTALPQPIPLNATSGMTRDVVVDLSGQSWTDHDYEMHAGGDRLFLSFVEDTGMTARYRFEAQLDYASLENGDSFASNFIVAAQTKAIPRIEFGGRIGYAGLNGSSGVPSGSGATDLDAWAKFHLGPRWMRNADFAFGGLVTLPTGSEDTGRAFDALRSEMFFSMRVRFASFILSTHAGVWFNENGEIGELPLEGTVAPALGVAGIYPLLEQLVIVAEARYESERFDGFGDDARLLAGVNWKPIRQGAFRFALSGGLTDGAPDVQFLGSWAIDF